MVERFANGWIVLAVGFVLFMMAGHGSSFFDAIFYGVAFVLALVATYLHLRYTIHTFGNNNYHNVEWLFGLGSALLAGTMCLYAFLYGGTLVMALAIQAVH